MGVDTNLWISARWEVDDVRDILIREYGTSVRYTTHDMIPTMVGVHFSVGKEERMMYFHHSVRTPLGTCHLLSLNFHGLSVEVMRKIAGVLGGLLQENDCNEQYELIEGNMSEGDALPYFIKYAIIHDGANPDSLADLKETISKWTEKIGPTNVIYE